ncbi:hypothetical protein NNA36_01825 [Shimia sp. CNT1-13L.2]|uniref:calcium-binding protein n=1 Tax=Shimia sp. CNT1-13L.2 TaxID=2959663 RepID=UPI0020CD31E3|nr:calcium-binding protein [Shimia sp. CNT1-13L.2]MCP9480692.1 hypothetical protein [Shimia sp. CNT1-13L.2]
MATFTGTSGSDTLIGTDDADILQSRGGVDFLSGGNGGDEYQMYQSGGLHAVTIDDNATDTATDSITQARFFYASASLGYSAWGSAERQGDDLHIEIPGKPGRFRKPGYGALTIDIIDHFGDGTVETLQAGDFTFVLSTSNLFSGPENALIAGDGARDPIKSGAGNDILFSNGGADRIMSGAGNDTVFSGAGRDRIETRADNDRVYSGDHNDTVKSGAGNDWVDLGKGNDLGRGGTGADWLLGQDGHDRLFGGSGRDMMVGGAGNDTLKGGSNGDIYQFRVNAPDATDHDVIRDIGQRKPLYNDLDIIDLVGLYGASSGSSSEAYAAVGFDRAGNDMIISIGEGTSTITVKDQFLLNGRSSIEQLVFDGGYWSAIEFQILDAENDDIGDDRRDRLGVGGEKHELIFGNDDDNQVFGDSGTNFIWLGGGADTLIYKESDPQLYYDLDHNFVGGGSVNDIVMDFDPLQDRLDFSEIKSLTFAGLTLSEASDGDTLISWQSGDFEVSSIFIELRGVALAELGEDHFLFA